MIGFFQQCGRLGIVFLNMGIVLGFTFGALILLRPVTGRLLRPKHQVWLWFAGWYVGFVAMLYDILGRRVRLPFSFRELVIPRVEGGDRAMPLYIARQAWEGPTLVLPGGVEAQRDLEPGRGAAAGSGYRQPVVFPGLLLEQGGVLPGPGQPHGAGLP